MIKVNICSFWTWLLHLHALELGLRANVLRSRLAPILLENVKSQQICHNLGWDDIIRQVFQLRHRSGWGTGNWKWSPSRPDVGTAPFKSIVTVSLQLLVSVSLNTPSGIICIESLTLSQIFAGVSFGTAVGIDHYDWSMTQINLWSFLVVTCWLNCGTSASSFRTLCSASSWSPVALAGSSTRVVSSLGGDRVSLMFNNNTSWLSASRVTTDWNNKPQLSE